MALSVCDCGGGQTLTRGRSGEGPPVMAGGERSCQLEAGGEDGAEAGGQEEGRCPGPSEGNVGWGRLLSGGEICGICLQESLRGGPFSGSLGAGPSVRSWLVCGLRKRGSLEEASLLGLAQHTCVHPPRGSGTGGGLGLGTQPCQAEGKGRHTEANGMSLQGQAVAALCPRAVDPASASRQARPGPALS